MLLKSFSIICSAICITFCMTGCAAKNPVDNKPVITICGIDIPKKLGNCGKTGQGEAAKSEPVPVEKLDKFFAISPTDYGIWKKYMDKLETYARYMDKKYKN